MLALIGKTRIVMIAVIAAIAIVMFLQSAHAQNEEDDSVIRIEGRILRPQASYIIQRANIDFGVGMKKKSFVDKIEMSLNEKPFQ